MLDRPPSFGYNYIMKNYRKHPGDLIKVRVRATSEVYYTYTKADTKEIDGITFIPVIKNPPPHRTVEQVYWMRKDNMERVK